MEVSDDLVADYGERGYAVIRNFFPRDMLLAYRAFLQQAMDRDVRPVFERAGLKIDDPNLTANALRLIQGGPPLTAADRQTLLGHFPLPVRLSDRIRPIARFVGESALLKAILGSDDLFMHMPPMARFVLPNYTPAGVPAHQDASYNAHMSSFVTIWTPLVPIDASCGGLLLFEGSCHLTQPVQTAANGWLDPIDVRGLTPSQPVGLDAGDVVLLSPAIVHASVPNTSERIRFSMDLRVFGAGVRSEKHHMNLKTLETIGN